MARPWSDDGMIEIELAGGRRLRVGRDAEALRRAVIVLERPDAVDPGRWAPTRGSRPLRQPVWARTRPKAEGHRRRPSNPSPPRSTVVPADLSAAEEMVAAAAGQGRRAPRRPGRPNRASAAGRHRPSAPGHAPGQRRSARFQGREARTVSLLHPGWKSPASGRFPSCRRFAPAGSWKTRRRKWKVSACRHPCRMTPYPKRIWGSLGVRYPTPPWPSAKMLVRS